MGILKDISLYFSFRKSIRKNRVELKSQFNIRIDNADRMYTVINIPASFFGEPYNLRKSDIDIISENYIKEYISKLSRFLDSIGVSEMYDYYAPIEKVDKYSYLIILGYKQIDSTDINKVLYRFILPITVISLLLTLFLLLK